MELINLLEGTSRLYHGDCWEVMKLLPSNSIDSVVTDPPSGIRMFGENWDYFKPEDEGDELEGRAELLAFQNFLVEVFTEVHRILKPGAFGLVWALPRTSHHTGMALERAGFDIRDRLAHLFSQGYKKGLDIKKALLSKGLIEEAAKWEGHHTGLKPALEDWWLIRKPISGKIIDNLLKYRTGSLNIDPSRVYTDWNEPDRPDSWKNSGFTSKPEAKKLIAPPGQGIECHPLGRWPANLLLSHAKYDYYRLRDDTPRDAAEAIYLYYDSQEALFSLREGDERDAFSLTEKEVLQCEVLCRQSEGDQEEGVGQTNLPNVQEGIRSDPSLVQKRKEEVLQQEVSRPSSSNQEKDRTPFGSKHKAHVRGSKREIPSREVLSVERREVLGHGGVLPCDSERSTRDCPGIDSLNDTTRLHNGASFSDGFETEQITNKGRNSSSPEWDQGRQPRGEPTSIQSEGSQHTTSRSGERVGFTEDTKPNFEILGERIPNGWFGYFEYSRTVGCRKIGNKVLKGDLRGDPGGTRQGGFYTTGSDVGDGKPNAHVYGNEEIHIYECVPRCPVRILNEQNEGASRYFKTFEPEYESNFMYQAKPSTSEKNADLDEGLVNEHKTVKSLKLMSYLVKLVTPPNGIVLDPFAGTGTTLMAAAQEGFDFLGIEKDPKSMPILQNRVANFLKKIEAKRADQAKFDFMLGLESD